MRGNSLPFAAVSAADQAAVAELANQTDHRLRLKYVAASYSGGAPAGGVLTIQGLSYQGETVEWQIDVPDNRPVVLPNLDLQTAAGAPLVITLAAAGAGVIGKVNAYAAFE